MNKIRRLQFIGKQYFLNMPSEMVRESKLQKGDYMEIMQGGNNNFYIRKVAENTAPRVEVILQSLRDEASGLFALINGVGSQISGGEFSGRQAQLSHIQAKIRRLEKKLNN